MSDGHIATMPAGKDAPLHPQIAGWQAELDFIELEIRREGEGHGFGWCFVDEIPLKIEERKAMMSYLAEVSSANLFKKRSILLSMSQNCKTAESVQLCPCERCESLLYDLKTAETNIVLSHQLGVVLRKIVEALFAIYNKPNVGVAF